MCELVVKEVKKDHWIRFALWSYQFDAMVLEKVIAEERTEGLTPYLGLQASPAVSARSSSQFDIPVQLLPGSFISSTAFNTTPHGVNLLGLISASQYAPVH